jgi:hypothetical protein
MRIVRTKRIDDGGGNQPLAKAPAFLDPFKVGERRVSRVHRNFEQSPAGAFILVKRLVREPDASPLAIGQMSTGAIGEAVLENGGTSAANPR